MSTTSVNEVSSTESDRMPLSVERSGASILNQIKKTLQSLVDKSNILLNQEPTTDEESISNISRSPILHLSATENVRTKEAYMERLSSFKPVDWMGKPLALSPPLLAQYGWKCIGLHTVKCCTCSAILVIKLPSANAENYLDKSLECRFKIISSHFKICLWPSYPCKESQINPFLPGNITPADIKAGFKKRFKSLIELGEDLPHIKPEFLEKYGFDDDTTLPLISLASKDSQFTDYFISLSAVVIACCGWTVRRERLAIRLFCEETNRSVNLSYFFSIKNSVKVPENEEIKRTPGKRSLDESDEENDKKRRKDNTGMPQTLRIREQWFDPVDQHYKWSPWIAVLKPITKDEFEMVVDDCDKYTNITQPLKDDVKVAWEITRDSLLGRSLCQPKTPTRGSTMSGVESQSDVSSPEVDKSIKVKPNTPPRAAIKQVQMLLKQWTSPK